MGLFNKITRIFFIHWPLWGFRRTASLSNTCPVMDSWLNKQLCLVLSSGWQACERRYVSYKRLLLLNDFLRWSFQHPYFYRDILLASSCIFFWTSGFLPTFDLVDSFSILRIRLEGILVGLSDPNFFMRRNKYSGGANPISNLFNMAHFLTLWLHLWY